jgi:hypothetical protein
MKTQPRRTLNLQLPWPGAPGLQTSPAFNRHAGGLNPDAELEGKYSCQFNFGPQKLQESIDFICETKWLSDMDSNHE